MNESTTIISSLQKAVKANGWACTKHADTSTKGVPDLSVYASGNTTWIEAKYLPLTDSHHAVGGAVSSSQLVRLRDIDRLTGRAWILVRRGSGKVDAYKPSGIDPISGAALLWDSFESEKSALEALVRAPGGCAHKRLS